MERLTHKEHLAVERHLKELRKDAFDLALSKDEMVRLSGETFASLIDLQLQRAEIEADLEAAAMAAAEEGRICHGSM